MKTIELIVKGSGYIHTKERAGKYVTVINYYKDGGKASKCIEGTDIGTTTNRMIIRGIIDGIRALKEPCNINIRTHCHFGYKRMEKALKNNNSVKGTNSDLLEELMNEIIDGRHEIELEITTAEL